MLTFIIENWGDIASFIGLCISIFVLRNTKKAIKAAHEAHNATLRTISTQYISETVSLLEEVKTLHRTKKWDLAQAKYPILRKLLLEIKHYNKNLTERQQAVIQDTIVHIRKIDQLIDKAIQDQSINSIKLTDFNEIISAKIEELQEILYSITSSMEAKR